MIAPAADTPRGEYDRRLKARRDQAARMDRSDLALARARLAAAIAGGVIAWAALFAWPGGVIAPWWLAVPAVAFVGLAFRHDTVLRAKRRALRAVAFYERGIERLEGGWAGKGSSGDRFLEGSHLYAADLDLFGKGSVFERLCAARTRAGEETLAAWLSRPATADETRQRQAAVTELRHRLDLREDLALIGEEVRLGVHGNDLALWGRAEPLLPAKPLSLRSTQALAFAASLVSAIALAGWAAGLWEGLPALAVLAAQGLFGAWLRPRVLSVIGSVDRSAYELGILSALLERIEREPVSSGRLAALRAALETGGVPPSARIARLRRLVGRLDWRRNQFFAPAAFLLMWGTHLACAIESWRARCGPAIAQWLRVSGEFEALCSLAGYAWENPADPMPHVLDDGPPPALFEAEGLGHPLLPDNRSVRNDLSLGEGSRVFIVSGSNMSGKSTLLRTVGVNAALAMAGAPVRATWLRLSPVVLGASLRIHDSLQEGTSHFYAEITRLRCIADLAREGRPVLFLVDEMLHGTNSHDRRIGAQGVIRGLVARGAVGLVTTHDLALSKIAEPSDGRVVNVHFEDRLEAGRMVFDYRLRAGVVTHSNALELMRAVGLEI